MALMVNSVVASGCGATAAIVATPEATILVLFRGEPRDERLLPSSTGESSANGNSTSHATCVRSTTTRSPTLS